VKALCGHFLLKKPSLVSATLVVFFAHALARTIGWKDETSRAQPLGSFWRRASTTFKTREMSGVIRRAPRSGRDKFSSDSTLAVVRSAFPSRQFFVEQKAERPILKGFVDQVEFLGMGIWCRKQDSNL
jgi:hypothetical protein